MRFLYLTRNRNYKSVFFCSFSGQYSDSPRAISEAIHELDPSINLVWRLKRNVKVPDYIVAVYEKKSIKKAQARADAWVMNQSSANEGDYKGKNIFFVSTWHGDRGFKRIGWAAVEKMGGNYSHVSSLPDMKYVDLFTAASDYGEMQAHEGLHYWGEIQKEGLPRNDKLVYPGKYKEYAQIIRRQLDVEEDVKILLYAPTFRDNQKTIQETEVNLEETKRRLEKNGEKWVCLLRAHKLSKGLSNEGRFKDVTNFGDMADLLLVTDCLITDYSSCAGDFVLMGKPCILAHFDKKNYEKNSRSLWYNPEKTGFLIANNQDELNEIVDNLYSFDHKKISEKILSFYGTYETGHSAIITAKRIVEWINNHH